MSMHSERIYQPISYLPMPKQPVYNQHSSRTYLRRFFPLYNSESTRNGRGLCSPLPGNILQPRLASSNRVFGEQEEQNLPRDQNQDNTPTDSGGNNPLKKPSGLLKASLQEVLNWSPETFVKVQVFFSASTARMLYD